jgi:hypothetical protein
MLEDSTLGWYGFHGTVYISLDVVEDPELLVSVLNHEDTHRTLCATTSHGLLQEALDLGRDLGFDEPPASTEEMRSVLLAESRFLQEATATYCGMVFLDDAKRAARLRLLPEMYLAGWQLFESLLAKHAFEPVEAMRLARAFGCRAMQTSVLMDWDIKQLSDPANLRKYLEKPENSPNERFKILLDYFADAPKDALAKFCGGHIVAGVNRLLMPPGQPAIGKIEFRELPALESVRAQAESIVSDLFPERFSGERERRFFQLLGGVGIAEISLQPATFPLADSTADEKKWLSNADLVQIDRNISDKPVSYETARGKDTLDAGSARLYFRRPDSLSALKLTTPAEQLPSFLTDVDPHENIAVVVTGSTTWLPPVDEFKTGKATPANPFGAWTGKRPTMLYTSSRRSALYLYCNMLDDLGDELIIRPLQAGETWGLILIRSSAEVWPMVIHPTLITEWNDIQDHIFSRFSFRINPSPLTFFKNEQTAMAVVKFLRAYQGLRWSTQYWAEFSKFMAAHLLGDAGSPVDSIIHRMAYRDDL